MDHLDNCIIFMEIFICVKKVKYLLLWKSWSELNTILIAYYFLQK